MVLVEGWIVAKMGVTPQSIALMIAYNVAWAVGAIVIGDALTSSSQPQSELTYVGGGVYRDKTGNSWQEA